MQADDRRSTTARAFAVLDIVAGSEGGTMTLTEIAVAAGLPTPTAYRYVRELTAWGGIERVGDGRYRLSMHLWQLGTRSRWDRALRQACAPALEQVTRATGFGASVVWSDGPRVVTVERRFGVDKAQWISPVGAEIPLSVSTAGLLAVARRDERIERYLPGVPPQHTATAERVIDDARRHGYAIGVGLMLAHQGAVSVPVPGEHAAGLSLTLIFPAGRTDSEAHVEQLRLSAAALSVALRRTTPPVN